MYPITTVRIRSYERGFCLRRGELAAVLGPGTHRYWNPLFRTRVDVLSARDPWINHTDLDLAARGGHLQGIAELVELSLRERAIVWIDGSIDTVLAPGRYALWTGFRELKVERITVTRPRLQHDALATILGTSSGAALLEPLIVPQGAVGLVYVDGVLDETLPPGQYAFWKGVANLKHYTIDRREAVLDVAGQEIMTRDKVTLRLNALVTFRITDAATAVSTVEDFRQALYRDAQMALRAAVGSRPLDDLLADKDAVAGEVSAALQGRARALGLEVASFGLRDIILPGEMKELLNRVIAAQKASEAALITRREETAAMRNQANTARLLENNPTLMRLRELEVIERIAQGGKLSLVVGEKGIGDRLLNLL